MLRFFQPEKTNDNHYTLLINDLHQTAQDLQDAYRNLENVIDPDLIDCYIYELNSTNFFLQASATMSCAHKKIQRIFIPKILWNYRNPDKSPPDCHVRKYTRHTPAAYFS